MKKVKKNLTPKVLASAISIIIAGSSGMANALEAKFSGHVNRAVMTADDGDSSKAILVDNENSSTRIRFTGSEAVSDYLTIGIQWETEYESNNSSNVNLQTRSTAARWNERHSNIYFSGDFGKVSFGQGSGAADGATESDQSGTDIASYSGLADVGGSIEFLNKANVGTGATIGNTSSNLDFEGRYQRVRYDSPKFGAAKVSVSGGHKGDNDVFGVGVRVNNEMGGAKVSAALGYSSEAQGGANGSQTHLGGSVSVMTDQGFNIALSYGSREDDNSANADVDNTYVKVGYRKGMHAYSIDYGMTNDLGGKGNESTAIGAQYVYRPAGWAELYAAVKVNSFETTASTDFEDITIGLFGARIKF